MRFSNFFIRFLLSYSYLFTGIIIFGISTVHIPDFFFHPFTVMSIVLFIAGWIWIAKTYLGLENKTLKV